VVGLDVSATPCRQTSSQRNAEALEIVFDDGRDDAPTDRDLPRAS
jgi:hypothetical protein